MTTRGKTRAAVYGRESQANRKSIRDQVDLGAAEVAEQGWTLAGSYDDGTSASRYARQARDGWDKLLADLAAGAFDVLVVWEVTRADRDLESWVTVLNRCRAAGIRVHVIADERTYDPRRARDYRDLATAGVDAAYETDRLGERVRRGKAAAAAAGRPAGKITYGYARRYHPETREPIQEPHPEHAPIVVEIITRVADGEPVKRVADDLTARQVPTPGGGSKSGGWYYSTVRAIAMNVAYIGLVRHNGGDTYPAVWPPLVPDEVFWAAQRIFSARKGVGWRSGRAEHLLTGIPVCAKCGETYRGRFDTHLDGRQRYGCRNGCGYVDGAGLEKEVLAFALGRLARRDVYRQLRRAGQGADRERAAAQAEADRLRERLEEARESAASPDGITYAALAVQERELGAQITAAEQRAERAGVAPAVRKLADAGQALPQVWADMPTAARRDVLRDLVTVTVRPLRGGRNRPTPRGVPVADRVTVTWRSAR